MKQEKDGAISYEGFCIDLLKQLAKILHFTYEIYLSPDGQYGKITQKGTWNGIIGELVNKVSTLCDISLSTAGQSDRLDPACPIKSCCHHQCQHIHEKKSAVACRRGSEKPRFGTKISLLTGVKLPDRKKNYEAYVWGVVPSSERLAKYQRVLYQIVVITADDFEEEKFPFFRNVSKYILL